MFTAGMLAAVNPCGFALLPAYLSYYLGMTDDAPVAARRGPVLGAIAVGGAMTAGFLAVFVLIGSIWSSISSWLAPRLPWITIIMGIVLVLMGIALLAGKEPTARLPKLGGTAGSGTIGSMVLFGISYAIASLSCTLPLFVGALGLSFDRSFLDGLASFAAYGLGMGALVTALTVAVALARQGLVRALRRVMTVVGRISGGLLLIAGVIVIGYGWSETRSSGSAFSRWMLDRQAGISSWITHFGALRLALISAVLIGGAVAASIVIRKTAPPHPESET
jgi:cytochrome c biogenesis protein CcdA